MKLAFQRRCHGAQMARISAAGWLTRMVRVLASALIRAAPSTRRLSRPCALLMRSTAMPLSGTMNGSVLSPSSSSRFMRSCDNCQISPLPVFGATGCNVMLRLDHRKIKVSPRPCGFLRTMHGIATVCYRVVP